MCIRDRLSTHQQADPKLISIISRLEAGDETISQYYTIHNGILFSKPSLYKEEWKVIIPTHIEKEIVFNYHVRYGRLKGGKGPGRELPYQRHKSEGTEVY